MKALDVPRAQITSSMIESAGWREGMLVIEFKNGSVYAYHAPQEYFYGMMAAESAGKYFHARIKPLFEGEKVTDGT